MLEVKDTTKYRKDRNKLNTKQLSELDNVIERLRNKETLEAKYRVHPLKNNLKGYMDLHMASGILLIYRYINDVTGKRVLELCRVGRHSGITHQSRDVFKLPSFQEEMRMYEGFLKERIGVNVKESNYW